MFSKHSQRCDSEMEIFGLSTRDLGFQSIITILSNTQIFKNIECSQTNLINDTKFTNSPNVQRPSFGDVFQCNTIKNPPRWSQKRVPSGISVTCMRISGNLLCYVQSYVRSRQFNKLINFTQMCSIRAEYIQTVRNLSLRYAIILQSWREKRTGPLYGRYQW